MKIKIWARSSLKDCRRYPFFTRLHFALSYRHAKIEGWIVIGVLVAGDEIQLLVRRP